MRTFLPVVAVAAMLSSVFYLGFNSPLSYAQNFPDARSCSSWDKGTDCEVAKLKERVERSERVQANQAEQIRRMQAQIDSMMSRVNNLQGRSR